MTSRFRKAVISLWPYALVIFVYAAFRLVELDRFVHIDEPHWLGRSMNFYRALASGELQHTYQREHPGVLTMWAGAIAWFIRFPEVATLLSENVENPYQVSQQLWSWGQDPMDIMVAARVSKVLLQSVFFAASLAFLHRLIGKYPALFVGALIAMSTTMIGWDSWLHIDGMSAIATFAGFTATAFAAESTRLAEPLRRNTSLLWLVAGAISSTAWLNRITALSLIGVAGLALLLQLIAHLRSDSHGRSWRLTLMRNTFLYGSYWILGGVLGSFALLPALWVNPIEIINEVVGLPIAGVLGRGDPAFFPEGTHLDRDLTYLLTEIRFRMTPFEWLGVILLVALVYFAWKRQVISASTLRLVLLAACFAAVNLVGLAASPKVYSRYLMVVYPLTTLMAGLGIVTCLRLLRTSKPNMPRALSFLVVALILAYSLAASTMSLPYKLIYSNPVESAITGRSPGQPLRPGQDQVASFINNSVEERPILVHPSGIRYALRYFVPTEDSGVHLSGSDLSSPSGWYRTDYALVVPSSDSHLFGRLDPVRQITVQDELTYEIYAMDSEPAPSEVLSPNACHATLGDSKRLLQVVGSENRITLYLLDLNGESASIDLMLDFGPGLSRTITTTINPVQPGWITNGHFDRPEDVPADDFPPHFITIRSSSDSGEMLPIVDQWRGTSSDSITVLVDCYEAPYQPSVGPKTASPHPQGEMPFA